jgi:hypothetical protein
VISNVQVSVGQTTATITWQTNEAATSVVDYGQTLAYELGTYEDLNLVTNHSVTINGLDAGTSYYYQITSEDGLGYLSNSADLSFMTQTNTGGPSVDIWYGNNQTFGVVGIPQTWINVLGNAYDSDGIQSLTYSLNNGPEFDLSLGWDGYRLDEDGDFNIEIAFSSLQPGSNQVLIRAVDMFDNETAELVTVNFDQGNTWPLAYSIDWSTVGTIEEVAQVVDGKWELTPQGIRSSQVGYDRLVAIGDMAWENYEATLPITINAIEPYYDYPSNNPGLGILLRWQGHKSDSFQPHRQWWPLGLLGMHRWYENGSQILVLYGDQSDVIGSTGAMPLYTGNTYMWKIRCETVASVSYYKLKIWLQGDPEPVSWTVEGTESNDQQTTGSLAFVAHHVDATFGNISIVPLP